MNDNMALKAAQLTFKFFFLILKAFWYVLTYGFRMYKRYRDQKEEELRRQTRLAQNATTKSN